MIKRIHINQHKIRSNKKHNLDEPVITVKTSKSNNYAHSVEIKGPSKIVYSPDKPLSCGAKVWIETESEVVLNER
jgi:ribosomal protein L1